MGARSATPRLARWRLGSSLANTETNNDALKTVRPGWGFAVIIGSSLSLIAQRSVHQRRPRSPTDCPPGSGARHRPELPARAALRDHTDSGPGGCFELDLVVE